MKQIKQIVDILATEYECVTRQDTPKCNRDCKNCDLLKPTEDVLRAYEAAITILVIIDTMYNKLSKIPPHYPSCRADNTERNRITRNAANDILEILEEGKSDDK